MKAVITLAVITLAVITLAGCANVNKALDAIDTTVAKGDLILRDKCNYLQNGTVQVARPLIPLVPVAGQIVAVGVDLFESYCTGQPISNLVAALAGRPGVRHSSPFRNVSVVTTRGGRPPGAASHWWSTSATMREPSLHRMA